MYVVFLSTVFQFRFRLSTSAKWLIVCHLLDNRLKNIIICIYVHFPFFNNKIFISIEYSIERLEKFEIHVEEQNEQRNKTCLNFQYVFRNDKHIGTPA